MVLVMFITSLKSCFIFIFFLHFNVIKPYREIEARELVYFSNPFLYFCNK